MTSKLKTDILETVSGSGTIALTNQLSGMTSASVPAGSVIQVVNSLLTGGVSTSSSTFVDSGLTATITPTSTSSKILITVNCMSVENSSTSAGTSLMLQKDNADLLEWAKFVGYTRVYTTNHPCLSLLNSPSTTSAVTYKVQMRRGTGAGNSNMNSNSATSSITLQEIKG